MTNTKRIRILMIEKDLTVNAAATAIGVSPANLSTMIRGHLKLYRFRKPLADLLKVPVLEIFPDGTERKHCYARRTKPNCNRGKRRRRAAG